MITVDLFSDPICPWCFIGKRRMEMALSVRPDVEVDVLWHAFQLNPTMPAAGMDRQEYISMKFGNPENARRLYDNIRTVGEQVGIPFAFDKITRTPSTLNAHRLIRHAAETRRQDEIVERLFSAHFLDGIDIGSIDCLAKIASELGFDRGEMLRYLADDENTEDVRNEDRQARQIGVRGVPFYILNRQYAISGAQEPEAFHPLFDMLLAQTSELVTEVAV